MGARLAIVLLLAAATAGAQCPQPSWSGMNQLPGLAGIGSALTSWDPDGAGPAPAVLVVGGGFTSAGGVPAVNVATWDGAQWHALGAGVGVTTDLNEVHALCVYNGEVIIAGQFTTAGGAPANRIARWNGSIWQPLGQGLDGVVYTLAVYNGELIAGGSFSASAGVPMPYVARWNGSVWQSLPNGPDANVGALCIHNGLLIAGGGFTSVGGQPAGRVASWDGTTWQPLGAGAGGISPGGVGELVSWNGKIIAGGWFATAGGIPAQGIASWDGSTWSPVGSGALGPYPFDSVDALGVFGGDLIAGGFFTTIGGVAVEYLARWDGAAWHPFGTGLIGTNAFAIHAGELFAAGFVGAPTVAADGVARWNGSSWQGLSPGLNTPVFSLTTAFGELIVAVRISTVTGSAVPTAVHRWDGASWTQLGTGMDDQVNAMTMYNGELIAAGAFTQADGQPMNGIARWVGSGWAPLGSGINGTVHALAEYNGELIAGGTFSSAGGSIAYSVARWNGSTWLPLQGTAYFPFGPGVSTAVYSLLVVNGVLIVGGYFQYYPSPNIALWNGAAWHPFGTGTFHYIETLGIYDGELIAGVSYPPSVLRWNGSSWQPLGGGGLLGTTQCLAIHDGELIAGGGGGSNIARWNGSTWQTLGPGVDGPVHALASWQGALVAGGFFVTAGGIQSYAIARWSRPLPLLSLSQGGTGAPVQATNRWLIPGHEYYNVVSLDLAPGGPGTGPYGGLWFSDLSFLIQQLALPLQTPPTHFSPTGTEVTFGPYALPAGIVFEAVCADVTGGVLGCLTPAQQFTVY
jgi:trimeric autotransporter adhesin